MSRPRRAAERLVLVGLTLLGGGWAFSSPQAPQQAPTFRAGVRTVPVYVTVSDGAGGFAVNLTADAFEVKDNGTVQAITQFATTSQPLSSLVLLDGSASMWPILNSVLTGANNFILRMLPGDRTAVASFADRFQMRQPFTGDRDALLAHVADQFNLRLGVETRLWEALAEATLAVGREEGRRVIVILSDGKNWTPERQSATRPAEVIGLAIGRDVMIYGIAMWTHWDGRPEAPARLLAQVAEETGGGAIELRETDDLNATFTRIAQELRQQYVLGFTPAVLDGKVHRLEVRVKRPGMRARARRSYLAADAPPKAPLPDGLRPRTP